MTLLEQVEVTPIRGHKLYFDNYFTSLRLVYLTKNKYIYYTTGTLRLSSLQYKIKKPGIRLKVKILVFPALFINK